MNNLIMNCHDNIHSQPGQKSGAQKTGSSQCAPLAQILEGTVENIIFQNTANSFTVFRLRPYNAQEVIAVTGNFPPPFPGEEISASGKWVEHPRFGRQFQAESYIRLTPSSSRALERFLSSGFLKGVGQVMAGRLVKHFGEEILEIIEHYPNRLREVAGVGRKTARSIHQSYLENSELREIMFFLETHNISGAYAAKIYDVYGANAIDKIKNHPYRLSEEVKGVGFALADQIALAAGISRNSPERIVAGIKHLLTKMTQTGHSCLPEKILIDKAAEFLSLDTGYTAQIFRENLKNFWVEDYHGMNLIYPQALYLAEKKVAERLLSLKAKASSAGEADIAKMVQNWEDKEAILLSEEQKEALAAALEHGVMVLTGGPGTGKTTIVKGILALLEEQGLKIMLGAPTGRAAKRLSEATGREAMTVHRLLEAGGSDDEPLFLKDELEPLDADAIIIDETSMMDIMLMSFLLKAVPDGCRVILAGDADQLPSVGPGAVLKDIIRSKVVPIIKLTEVFRQAGESLIVLNAHRINNGLLPECEICPDFQFRQIEDAEETAKAIVKLCAKELKEEGFDVLRQVQVLSPMHRQVCGVENLNRLLQNALNPPDEYQKASLSIAGHFLREGDKVMQIKNNYSKRVFNGDIGYILAIEDGAVLVRYPEDDVFYERGEHDEITLSYAMSVHKSQGSEYPVIIIPLILGHQIMLQRNLLYTAATRAKERVILLGSMRALRLAVKNDNTKKRYSLLAERLKGEDLC